MSKSHSSDTPTTIPQGDRLRIIVAEVSQPEVQSPIYLAYNHDLERMSKIE